MPRKDSLTTHNGKALNFTFFGHASFSIEFDNKFIYIDPVGAFGNFASQPKADIILITHLHDDHLDKDAIEVLSKNDTVIISTETAIAELGSGMIMANGDKTEIGNYLGIEAIAAYNTTEGRDKFHPNTGRDNGYILTLGGSRIYISGDTEPTPEMAAIEGVDVAFLSVNQPYTMTVEQAVNAVKRLHPTVFYPYHYGQTEYNTDIEKLQKELTDSGIDVRIMGME